MDQQFCRAVSEIGTLSKNLSAKLRELDLGSEEQSLATADDLLRILQSDSSSGEEVVGAATILSDNSFDHGLMFVYNGDQPGRTRLIMGALLHQAFYATEVWIQIGCAEALRRVYDMAAPLPKEVAEIIPLIDEAISLLLGTGSPIYSYLEYVSEDHRITMQELATTE